MLLDEQFRECAAFVYVDKEDKETGKIKRIPAATAFFVSMPLGNDRVAIYAVTARHVIDSSRQYGPLCVRINIKKGRYEDFEVSQDLWIRHPDTDIALIDASGLPWKRFDIRPIPRELLVTDEMVKDKKISAGDNLFIIGLFTEFAGKERNQPIVRFGNISLMPHEKISIKVDMNRGGLENILVDAYLAEAHSWGGHSGSPVFIYFPPDRNPGMFRMGPFQFAFLGLLQGHYEINRDVEFLGDITGYGTGKVPVNSGIAIVIPSQKILELLDAKELIESREKALAEIKPRLSK